MRITTIIFLILGLFLLIPITAAINTYFPWEGGFKKGTLEYEGHFYGRHLQSVDECAIDSDMGNNQPFQRGCRAFFE